MADQRARLAQNFIHDPRLAASIVAQCAIDKGDTVYEIGPGKGIFTRLLAARAGQVIAIEKDATLAARLNDHFRQNERVQICRADFLRYQIRAAQFKIFGSIPFNITTDIVRKIVHGPKTPTEAYLIVQKEAAYRFAGQPQTTRFSALLRPFFDLYIVRGLRRTAFSPMPDVDSVLLRIHQRAVPLVPHEQAQIYRRFVKRGFAGGKGDLKGAYKRTFTYRQWKWLAQDLGFPLRATPSQLSWEQWLGLFEHFLALTPRNRMR